MSDVFERMHVISQTVRSLHIAMCLSVLAVTQTSAQEQVSSTASEAALQSDPRPAQVSGTDLVGRIAVGGGYGTHDVFSINGATAKGGGPHADVRIGIGRRLTMHDSLLAEVYWQRPFIIAGGEVADEQRGEVSSARIQSVIGFGLAYERDLRSAPWTMGGGVAVLYRPLDVSAFRGATEDMVQGGGLGFGIEANLARYWAITDAIRVGASLAGGSQLYFDESERFVAGYMSLRAIIAFE